MKNKLSISDIRSLLHKYYEGDTTPEEENLLESFLHDSSAEELPEDMNEDLTLFSSLAELQAKPCEMEVPPDLNEKINSITEEYFGIPQSKSRWTCNRSIAYAVAAACLCLVLTLGMRWLSSPDITASDSTDHIASAHTEQPKQHPGARLDVTEMNESSGQKQPTPATIQQKSPTTVKLASVPEEEDCYVEITEPEEAEKIITEIGNLLAVNSRKTNEALRNLEKTVDEYKKLTKSILQ